MVRRKFFGYVSNYDGIANDRLVSNVSLGGADWTVKTLRFTAEFDTMTTITDLDSGLDRQIDFLGLGFSSNVNLLTTRVKHIQTFDGGTHNITLGEGHVYSVSLWGDMNTLTTGAGFVTSFQTDGKAVVNVGSGGIGTIRLEDQDDTVNVTGGGDVDLVRMRGGDDVLTVTTGAHVQFARLGNGVNSVTASDDSRVKVITSDGGDNTVVLNDSSRAQHIKLDNGTNSVTTHDAWLESFWSYESSNTLRIGAGGAGQIAMSGSAGKIQHVTSDGYLGSLQVFDDMKIVVKLNSDAGSIRLDDGKDTVITGRGWVEAISTGGGNDTVRMGAGGGGMVRLGSGNDRILYLRLTPHTGLIFKAVRVLIRSTLPSLQVV